MSAKICIDCGRPGRDKGGRRCSACENQRWRAQNPDKYRAMLDRQIRHLRAGRLVELVRARGQSDPLGTAWNLCIKTAQQLEAARKCELDAEAERQIIAAQGVLYEVEDRLGAALQTSDTH